MRAVLMAGGEGVRMRPLTATTPKPLLPVVGRPLLAHMITLLARHGITDLIITVHYQAAQIRQYFGDGTEYGVRIRYVTESRPMGTAGSVKAAHEALRDEPFLVLSGDALADVDLTAFQASHRDAAAALSMVLAPRSDPREFGVAVLDDTGRVRSLVEKPGWGDVLSDRVNTGIYCVDPQVLDRVPAGRSVDWAADVIPGLLADDELVHGYVTDRYWQDVGSLPAYLQAQADLLARRAGPEPDGFELRPGIWLGEGVELDPTAHLVAPAYLGPFSRIERHAVIGPDTVIGANTVVRDSARIEHCVLLDSCRIDAGAELRGAIVGRNTQALRGCRVDEGAVVADDCWLGEESVVARGVHVFPGKSVDAGSLVAESLVWEAQPRKQLFGPRGVSGLINLEVTTDLAGRLAAAFASTLPKASVVTVGRDHSRAARAYNRAIIGALTASGMFVRDLRTAAVPIVRADTANHSAGGIVLTTTPGHPDALDLMVLTSAGTDIDSATQRVLERVLRRNEFRRPSARDIGDVVVPHRVAEDYVNHMLGSVNTAGIDQAGLRVVVDSGGGAATMILPTLLGRLGVQVLSVNNWLDEQRPTDTGSNRERALTELAAVVANSRADFGVRFDPAGERLALVDDTGNVVPDDRAALIVADLVCAETHGTVALPVTATRVADLVTAFHGANVLRTGAGSAALVAEVPAGGVALAADAEGGFIIPSVGAHLDPFAAFVLLLGLVARTRLTLSAIDARIPPSYVVSTDIVTPWARKAAVMRLLRERAGDREVSDGFGGLRIAMGARRWVFLRSDPAEAATGVWAEGESLDDAQQLLGEWAEAVFAAI